MKWWHVDISVGSPVGAPAQVYSYTVRGDDVVAALREACRLGGLDHTAVQALQISQLVHAPTPAWEGRRTRARRPE